MLREADLVLSALALLVSKETGNCRYSYVLKIFGQKPAAGKGGRDTVVS